MVRHSPESDRKLVLGGRAVLTRNQTESRRLELCARCAEVIAQAAARRHVASAVLVVAMSLVLAGILAAFLSRIWPGSSMLVALLACLTLIGAFGVVWGLVAVWWCGRALVDALPGPRRRAESVAILAHDAGTFALEVSRMQKASESARQRFRRILF
jgi:hypothetical protein